MDPFVHRSLQQYGKLRKFIFMNECRKISSQTTLKYAFRASLPVMAGYIVLGIGFGILLESSGYSWIWALVMSLVIYAGSMQYVTINLLTGGASIITAALMTLMVNVRHLFYGITMLEKYKDTGSAKPYLIFSLTDETFSLVCSPEFPDGVDRRKYYLFVSLFDQFYWVAGSVIGGLVGSAFTFNTTGIDFSMTALFTVIFIDQWEKAPSHAPALCGIVISIACLLAFGASSFLIPSMIGITIAMFIMKPFMQKKLITVSEECISDNTNNIHNMDIETTQPAPGAVADCKDRALCEGGAENDR